MEPDIIGLTILAIAAVTLAAPVPALRPTVPAGIPQCAEAAYDEATYYFSLQGQGMISLVPRIMTAGIPETTFASCP